MHSLLIRRQLSCLDKALPLTRPAIFSLSYSAKATNHNEIARNSLQSYFNSPTPNRTHNIILTSNTRFLCDKVKTKSEEKTKADSEKMSGEEKGKKPSKFKVFYRQYGPSFLVIHMSTVVAILYVFFLISKQ